MEVHGSCSNNISSIYLLRLVAPCPRTYDATADCAPLTAPRGSIKRAQQMLKHTSNSQLTCRLPLSDVVQEIEITKSANDNVRKPPVGPWSIKFIADCSLLIAHYSLLTSLRRPIVDCKFHLLLECSQLILMIILEMAVTPQYQVTVNNSAGTHLSLNPCASKAFKSQCAG